MERALYSTERALYSIERALYWIERALQVMGMFYGKIPKLYGGTLYIFYRKSTTCDGKSPICSEVFYGKSPKLYGRALYSKNRAQDSVKRALHSVKRTLHSVTRERVLSKEPYI